MCEPEASSRLVGLGPPWAVAPQSLEVVLQVLSQLIGDEKPIITGQQNYHFFVCGVIIIIFTDAKALDGPWLPQAVSAIHLNPLP